MKYNIGDEVVVVSVGGITNHNYPVGSVGTYMGESGYYGGSLIVDIDDLRQFLSPEQVLPYYDLEGMRYNESETYLSNKFVWCKTPEGSDYWSKQFTFPTKNGQEKLDAMAKLYEFYESQKAVGERASIGITLEDFETFGYKPLDTPSFIEALQSHADGGPQTYYDLPPDVVTLNDLIEYKSYNQWLGDTAHLFNIFKAAWRWGIKEGTSKEYDARKFIYSGARLLMHYAGVEETRKTLQKMLDDPQFQKRNTND